MATAIPSASVATTATVKRQLDFVRFREIADEVGAYLMVDMAHFAGLVAAGLHPSPIAHAADVVTTTTHKTLGGPRAGLILCRAELAKKIESEIVTRAELSRFLSPAVAENAVGTHRSQPTMRSRVRMSGLQILDIASTLVSRPGISASIPERARLRLLPSKT